MTTEHQHSSHPMNYDPKIPHYSSEFEGTFLFQVLLWCLKKLYELIWYTDGIFGGKRDMDPPT